jgi:hypothetical protein
MSKSNVNPNHYKVAGRERQGEDIAQARNKQKHAESLVRRRAEVGAGFQIPAPARGTASPGVPPARAAKTAARKPRAASLHTPPGQRRGHNLVPGSTGPHARFPKAARGAVLQPIGAAPKLNAKQATERANVNVQGADKRGKRSTAQKRASSRHEFDSMPATKAVAGAFGKEPSPRRRPTRKG